MPLQAVFLVVEWEEAGGEEDINVGIIQTKQEKKTLKKYVYIFYTYLHYIPFFFLSLIFSKKMSSLLTGKNKISFYVRKFNFFMLLL